MNASSRVLWGVLVAFMSLAVGVLGGCTNSPHAGAWRADVPREAPAASGTKELICEPRRVDSSERAFRITFEIIGEESTIATIGSKLGDVFFNVRPGDPTSAFCLRDEHGREVEVYWDNGDPGWGYIPSTQSAGHTMAFNRVSQTTDGRVTARASVKYQGALIGGRSYTFEWRPESLRVLGISLQPTGPVTLVPVPILSG